MEKPKAVRLTYLDPRWPHPQIIYGLVAGGDDSFLRFRTGRGDHFIQRTAIIAIEPTDRDFQGVLP